MEGSLGVRLRALFSIGLIIASMGLSACADGVPPDEPDESQSAAIQLSPPVLPNRGATFFYLDGESQGFPWVLDNLGNATVLQRVTNLVTGLSAANVNWVRLLVAANHFPSSEYPQPPASRLAKMNRLLGVIHAVAPKMAVEVIFVTARGPDQTFSDSPPNYPHDKQWLTAWINGLNYTNVGSVLISGDLEPCQWNGTRVACEGDPDATAFSVNHGSWAKAMWTWVKSTWQTLQVGIEVTATAQDPYRDNYGDFWAYSTSAAAWADKNLPGLPAFSTPLYFKLAPGSSAAAYANETIMTLRALRLGTSKPIWFDEYGFGVGGSYSSTDQASALEGMLAGTESDPSVTGAIAWTTGRDYPYDGVEYFGLVDSFAGNTPVWQPAWSKISAAYHGTAPASQAALQIAQSGVATSYNPFAFWITGTNVPNTAYALFFDDDGSPWGVGQPVVLDASGGSATFQAPASLAPSNCNAAGSCTVSVAFVQQGGITDRLPVSLPQYVPIQVSLGALVVGSPTTAWVVASRLNAGVTVKIHSLGKVADVSPIFATDFSHFTFTVPATFAPYACGGQSCLDVEVIDAGGASASPNLFTIHG